jgi:hypothetical protein
MSVTRRPGPGGRRALLAMLGAATLLLVGCGEPAPDTTVTRSEQQAEQLRDRLQRVQGAS